MKTQKSLFSFVVAALVWSTSAIAQTPANDDFANRTVLGDSAVSFSGALSGGTIEPNEIRSPFYWTPGSSSSVWWTWTAPASTTVVIWFPPPQSTTNRLAIYTGSSLDTLAAINYFPSYTWEPAGRYVRFAATAGVSYQIQVIGNDLRPFSAQLIATNSPIFIYQPKDCTVSPYGSAIFSAMASGPPPPSTSKPGTTYQWYFNGTALPGQTFPSLLVHGVTTNQAGTYSVTASNIGGVTVGGSATLTVVETNSLPRVTALLASDSSQLQFSLTAEPGRWYKIESTSNLQNWPTFPMLPLPIWLRLTNETSLISIARLAPNYFARVSLDTPTDVCVAQLKQMRWAAKVWMIETGQEASANASIEYIRPYLPLDSGGMPPVCPDHGAYSSSWVVTGNPTCTVGVYLGRGHVLTDTQ